MDFWGKTDKGKVRKQNQDVFATYHNESANILTLVICDGMGGAKAGNVASSLAAEAFISELNRAVKVGDCIEALSSHLSGAVIKANRAVFSKSSNDAECSGMGTTLVAAVISGDHAVFANVGDSRAYHIYDGAIQQITKDHSVVEDLVARGDISRQEAKSHPNKNLITRALGASTPEVPDIFDTALSESDLILLCSDGVSNLMSDQELLEECLESGDVVSVCDNIVSCALERGAPDNVTVLLYCHRNEPSKEEVGNGQQ